MFRKLTVVVSVAALAAGAFATIALASSGSINDPTGDTRHSTPAPAAAYDIVKAGWGHTDGGKLKHWVVVDGTIGHPTAGNGSLPRLLINVPGQVADNPTCDYYIEARPPGVIPQRDRPLEVVRLEVPEHTVVRPGRQRDRDTAQQPQGRVRLRQARDRQPRPLRLEDGLPRRR